MYRAPGSSSGGSTGAIVTDNNVTLGTQAAARPAFTFYEVTDICARGMVSRLVLTPSFAGKYDVALRNANGGGEQFLAATDADGVYDISVPVYVEGDANGSIWIGIKNKGASSVTYTLTTLRVEKFA